VARLRSLLIKVEIDTAQRAHRCQANGRHEIKRGDLRLNVRAGRGWDRSCMDCARKIVDGSLVSLTAVSSGLGSGEAIPPQDVVPNDPGRRPDMSMMTTAKRSSVSQTMEKIASSRPEGGGLRSGSTAAVSNDR
jgi:hypothetical protein